MKDYHDDIRRAIEHAPFYGEEPAAYVTNAQLFAQAGEISEEIDTIIIDADLSADQPPYGVISDGGGSPPEELQRMFEAARDVTGYDWPDSFIAELVDHEGDHFTAAQQLRARDIRGMLKVTRNKDFPDFPPESPLFQASISPSMRTTKLGWAAMFVHPAEPSGGDVRALESLGMIDVFDVAARIQERNADRGPDNPDPEIDYPLPKMYTPDEIQELLAQMPERFKPHWNLGDEIHE